MENILITGATGFLGSHLIKNLINKYNIIILKRKTSSLKRIKDIINKIKYYNIDELSNIEEIFKNDNIHTVIHTAACYGRKGEDIYDILKPNLILPVKLIQLAVKNNVNTFINTDTFTKTNYGRLKYYSLSKHQVKKWLELFKDEIKILNLRIFHMYGEMDNESKFIHYIINKFLSNSESIDLTEGKQRRDFIYVKDVVKAYENAVKYSKKLNNNFYDIDIGKGETSSIRDLCEMIKKILKNNTTKLNFGVIEYTDNEEMDIKADTEKAEKLIKWKSKISLENGIKSTINWYNKNRELS